MGCFLIKIRIASATLTLSKEAVAMVKVKNSQLRTCIKDIIIAMYMCFTYVCRMHASLKY